ncbi:MAG: hypothetical protein ACOC1T_02175 [Halorhodospira sp.]
MTRHADINAWLIEHGYLTPLEELADQQSLGKVADTIQEIVENEAPELAEGAPWLALAAGFAQKGDGVTVVADTENGFAVCELSDLPPEAEYLTNDDFLVAIEYLQEGESIATTFPAIDQNLAWLDEEYGLQGWELEEEQPRWATAEEFFAEHPDHPGRDMYEKAKAVPDADRLVYAVNAMTALATSKYHGYITQAEVLRLHQELQLLAVRSLTEASASTLRPVE